MHAPNNRIQLSVPVRRAVSISASKKDKANKASTCRVGEDFEAVTSSPHPPTLSRQTDNPKPRVLCRPKSATSTITDIMQSYLTILPLVALSALSVAGPLPPLPSNTFDQISATATTGLPASYTIQVMNAERNAEARSFAIELADVTVLTRDT